jgi:hypothetical protein
MDDLFNFTYGFSMSGEVYDLKSGNFKDSGIPSVSLGDDVEETEFSMNGAAYNAASNTYNPLPDNISDRSKAEIKDDNWKEDMNNNVRLELNITNSNPNKTIDQIEQEEKTNNLEMGNAIANLGQSAEVTNKIQKINRMILMINKKMDSLTPDNIKDNYKEKLQTLLDFNNEELNKLVKPTEPEPETETETEYNNIMTEKNELAKRMAELDIKLNLQSKPAKKIIPHNENVVKSSELDNDQLIEMHVKRHHLYNKEYKVDNATGITVHDPSDFSNPGFMRRQLEAHKSRNNL